MGLPKIVDCKDMLGQDAMNDLRGYALRYLETLRTQLRTIRTSRVVDMRRILEGRPKEEIKSFPWSNASNVVVQVVASFTDQAAARTVMGIHNVDPLWALEVLGDMDARLQPERKRELLEDFLRAQAMDPATINLLAIEYAWFRNALAYGCQALKVNYVEEDRYRVSSEGKPVKSHGYHGPLLSTVPYEDFLMPPDAMPVEQMPFKAQALHLSRFKVEERAAMGLWDKAETLKVIAGPTQTESDQPRKDLHSDQKIAPSAEEDAQVFTLYECHLQYRHGSYTLEVILTLHPETQAMPRAIFRFYPPGIEEFLLIRLGGDTGRAYGLGFIEALQDYQEEITAIHNQRRDAATCANTNVLRITPGSQLDTMTTLYPMGIIPAAPGTIEWLELGRNPIETIQDENLVMQECSQRAGVHPSFSGSGSGGPNKRGTYSAMGTMSVMQEGNSRTDMMLALFRQPHSLLGQTLLGLNAHFGVDPEKLKTYGKDRELLTEALEAYAAGTMRVRVRPATASVNREVEKQNLMMMMQNLRQHYQQSMIMLQQIENPMTPPDTRAYLAEALQGMNTLMKWTVRNFGIHDGGQNVVPDTQSLVDKNQQQQKQQQQIAGQAGPPAGGVPNGAPQPPAPPMPGGIQ